MPNNRHPRNHRLRDEDAHNNNNGGLQPPVQAAVPREVRPVAGSGMANQPRQNDNNGERLQKCCTPGPCRFPDETVDPQDPYDAVKVICNNDTCTEGSWMHKDCFEEFEQGVLAYLRSCGRARSWSEKQRLQNLWTKKGYDLAFKACDCRCGRGHLRKDLDYVAPPVNENMRKQKKHKKKNDKPMPVVSTAHKSNSHSCNPTLNTSCGNHNPTTNGNHVNNNHVGTTQHSNGIAGGCKTIQQTSQGGSNGSSGRGRKNSTSSSTTTKTDSGTRRNEDNLHICGMEQSVLDNQTSPPPVMPLTPASGGLPHGIISSANNYNLNNNFTHVVGLPVVNGNPQLRMRTNSVSSTGSQGSHASSSSLPSSAGSHSPISSSPVAGDMFFKARKSSDASSDNGGIGGCGPLMFRQRQDLSAFASLPRCKQNPYNIRMENVTSLSYSFPASCSLGSTKSGWGDVCDMGACEAETRNFVLTNLLSKKMTSTRCVLCKSHLPVFDRHPLIDGTFFLSPQSYDEAAVQVIKDGRLQFLNAVCLGCLENRTDIKCVACKRPWDGRALVVGSMYTYDIFAAMPCCQKRLTCKCCRRAVVDVTKGLNFFSEYSRMIICPYCKANDYHFIRSLPETFAIAEGGAGGGFVTPICEY